MLKVGDFELHLINDAVTYVDGGGAFGLVPRKLWQRYFTPDADNNIPMHLNCLYVKAHGKHIVIDTGLGNKLDDKARRFWNVHYEGGLLKGLDVLGITPAQIDLVIATHLHADHAAGCTTYADAERTQIAPTFPNAHYVVQRREYEDAMRPNERTAATYQAINFDPLVKSGQMRLLDGDTELLAGVYGIVTRGHTPAHMSIKLESKREHAAFLCDLATYAVHFERLAWMTAYDVEPLYTLETKRIWQQWALETNALLVFPHDPFRPVARLHTSENGGLALETVPEPYVNLF